jgi:hypothetical protein
MSNAGLCRMVAAGVAITALNATLFGMISLSFPGEGKSAISGPSSGVHHGVNIGEMGCASRDCAGPECCAQLSVGL